MLAITVPLGAVTATPTQAVGAGPKVSIHISARAGEIYQYDAGINGDGPIFPATFVHAVVRDCPAGQNRRTARLVQDGIEAWWATGFAHGAADLFCEGGVKPIDTGLPFYSPSLHSGVATVTFGFIDSSGQLLVEETRQVRIP